MKEHPSRTARCAGAIGTFFASGDLFAKTFVAIKVSLVAVMPGGLVLLAAVVIGRRLLRKVRDGRAAAETAPVRPLTPS